jgi:hypothetical protein
MLRKVIYYGVIAGLVVGSILFGITVATAGQPPLEYGMVVGYLSMLLALSAVFIGIKRHRDQDLGGVIRFWPAFGMGLGITVIASILYVLAWEAALAVTGVDFGAVYANFLIEKKQAEGVSGEALAAFAAEMEKFRVQYADRSFRMPMTFVEIFPVGVLVSLVSAGWLRTRRSRA